MEEEEKAINALTKDDEAEKFAEAYEQMRDGRKQRKRKRKYVRKQVLISQIVLIVIMTLYSSYPAPDYLASISHLSRIYLAPDYLKTHAVKYPN